MNRNPLSGACLLALALAACSPQQSAAPVAAEPAAETATAASKALPPLSSTSKPASVAR